MQVIHWWMQLLAEECAWLADHCNTIQKHEKLKCQEISQLRLSIRSCMRFNSISPSVTSVTFASASRTFVAASFCATNMAWRGTLTPLPPTLPQTWVYQIKLLLIAPERGAGDFQNFTSAKFQSFQFSKFQVSDFQIPNFQFSCFWFFRISNLQISNFSNLKCFRFQLTNFILFTFRICNFQISNIKFQNFKHRKFQKLGTQTFRKS